MPRSHHLDLYCSEKMRSFACKKTKQDSEPLDRLYDDQLDGFIEPDFLSERTESGDNVLL
jgi:hypothetical protein